MLTLANPLWLLGLIPWTALLVYLLTGRRRTESVPFLDLWPQAEPIALHRLNPHLPPVPVIAVFAAALLSILAAARPQIGAGKLARDIVIIVDRGLTMSARDGDDRRFQRLAKECAPILSRKFSNAQPAGLVILPGEDDRRIRLADLPAEIRGIDPTAVDTMAAVGGAARNALLDSSALVVVLSDQDIGVNDPRLIYIRPARPPANVGIAEFRVRSGPSPQAMVQLRNDSPLTQANLRVSRADSVSVALPTTGAERNYFANMKSSPDVAEASVEPQGDIDAVDRAWALRGSAWPKVAPQCLLPMELQRMVDVYQKNRPAGIDSQTIAMVPIGGEAPANQPVALVMTDTTASNKPPGGRVEFTGALLASEVDWNAAVQSGEIAASQPDASWERIVWIGDRILVAQRTTPNRAIWVGIKSRAWAATPSFVVFWSRAFDWLGEGKDQYSSQLVGRLSPQFRPLGMQISPEDNGLWPGLYSGGGRTLALNASAPTGKVITGAPGEWISKLPAASSRLAAGRDLAPWVLAICVALVSIALAAWNVKSTRPA